VANIVSRRKIYPLNQSPLYKLKSRRKLAALFDMPVRELESLAKRPDNYRKFAIGKETDKPRKIEEPKARLERVHRRLFNLLRRIEPPEYLHSGVKGKSYITNAKEHIGSDTLITLDIRQFFPSTLGWHVFEFYHEIMRCTRDVSGLLTTLSTCDNHVPTGSCLSQIIAFYAHYHMFEEMFARTSSQGLKMTCYVDDITISGKNANGTVLYQVRGILKKRGLVSHPKKERIFGKGCPKEVTGSIIVNSGLRLPNRKHKKIHEEIDIVLKQEDTEHKLKAINVVLGRVVAACQSDSLLTQKVGSLIQERNRLVKLLKKSSCKSTSPMPRSDH